MDQFVNCLVLEIRQKDYSYAMRLLSKLFQDSFMSRMERIVEANKESSSKHRIVWLIGSKETTDLIKAELEKHLIRPRILRDSFLRRDFIHYHKGSICVCSKKVFKETQAKTSLHFE